MIGDYHTYFSNQQWSESDPVTLVTKLHELTEEYVVKTSGVFLEAHGVILSYTIYLAE